MAARALSRWQASGLHLLLSAALAAALLVPVLDLWFPGPLFQAVGVPRLLYVLVAVHVAIGPLLTLLVFKSGKPGMKFDLVVIGALQLAALAYGFSVVSLSRPAFIVFVVDRFELVPAGELPSAELQDARYEEFRSVPWNGPRLAAADLPQDPEERQRLIRLAPAGLDVQHFPRYYVPYAERRLQVLAHAFPLAGLRETEPETAKAVQAWVAATGAKEGNVRVLMLRARVAWVAVLVDPETAQPIVYLLGERIE